MMTEVGAAYFRADEAANLRDYLLKGGFLWADDFWGSFAWDWWEEQFSQVLPPHDTRSSISTPEHPLFHSQFVVKEAPQISIIDFWSAPAANVRARRRQRRGRTPARS